MAETTKTENGKNFKGFKYKIILDDNKSVSLVPVHAKDIKKVWTANDIELKTLELKAVMESKTSCFHLLSENWLPINSLFSTSWIKFQTCAETVISKKKLVSQNLSDPIKFFNGMNSTCLYLLLLWLGRNAKRSRRVCFYSMAELLQYMKILHIQNDIWDGTKSASEVLKSKLSEPGFYVHLVKHHSLELDYLATQSKMLSFHVSAMRDSYKDLVNRDTHDSECFLTQLVRDN
jgi:hypothetical protein